MDTNFRLTQSDLKTEVARLLREAILSGDLASGSKLNERELAENMGISRGPIREAIRGLTAEGLLVHVPRKGTHVSSISVEEAGQISSLRMALEGLAARLAVRNLTGEDFSRLQVLVDRMIESAARKDYKSLLDADFEFHRLVDSRSDHRYLMKFLAEISTMYRMFILEATKLNPDLPEIARSHQDLLEVLRRGSPEEAEQAAREHAVVGWKTITGKNDGLTF